MALMKTFAKNLKSLRTERKLSQAALAEKAGISVSYVSMLERAQRSPPLETIEAIGKAFKVAPATLLDR